MENLKIRFNLSMPFISDRYTTIDSIIVKEYFALMREKGRHASFTDDLSSLKFIDSKGEVLSGSIWYIPQDAPIKLDFTSYYKKPEIRKIFDVALLSNPEKPLKDDFSKTEGKAFAISEELILTPYVYFYIRGEKGPIEQLLRRVKHFGKKRSIGFGKIESIEVEVMKNDFSYQLNECTPSKPLPVKEFNVDSKKIAYFRKKPPYWETKDLEACYMPTTALYELYDYSALNKRFSVVDHSSYKSGVSFLVEIMDGKKGLPRVCDTVVDKDKRKRWEFLKENNSLICGATGDRSKEGIVGFSKYAKKGFTSQKSILRMNYISLAAFWSMKVELIQITGDSLLTKSGLSKVTLTGAEEGKRFADYIKNPYKLKPPFVLMRKEYVKKQEHLALRSRVAVSNALYPLQYGDTTHYMDSELLLQAVKDVNRVLKLEAGPTKSHLLGLWRGMKHPRLSNVSDTKENREIVSNFHKKYDKSIRLFLFSIKDFS